VILLARIFTKEATEFSRSRGLLLLGFVAPVALMLLIGNLSVRDSAIRVAIVATDPEPASFAQLQSTLGELSDVEVLRWPSDIIDARARSAREDVDLVIIWEDGWHYYSPLTNRYRLELANAVVQDLALSVERRAALDRQLQLIHQLDKSVSASTPAQVVNAPSEVSGAAAGIPNAPTAEVPGATPGSATPTQPDKPTASNLVESLEREVNTGTSVPIPVIMAALSSRLVPYFPPFSRVNRSVVPGFIALIAVFLPFLLASGGLIKEREAGTVETLVLAARRNWAWVAMGKLMLPVSVAMITTLLLLVVARTAYGFGIKPGLAPALAVQFLAALAAALFGFSISTLIKSQQTAYISSALYLVGLILVTGIFYPIEQAGAAVMIVSYAFPLTFSGPPLEAWMTQGADAALNPWHLAGLLAQFVVAISLCVLALYRAQRSL
jgi:ABC-type multidrug transport system permease subunit